MRTADGAIGGVAGADAAEMRSVVTRGPAASAEETPARPAVRVAEQSDGVGARSVSAPGTRSSIPGLIQSHWSPLTPTEPSPHSSHSFLSRNPKRPAQPRLRRYQVPNPQALGWPATPVQPPGGRRMHRLNTGDTSLTTSALLPNPTCRQMTSQLDHVPGAIFSTAKSATH